MIESVRRVTLTWPLPPAAGELGGLTLTDIEAAFTEWIAEARGRGAPDTARAGVIRHFTTDRHALIVEWDAADDVDQRADQVDDRPETAGKER